MRTRTVPHFLVPAYIWASCYKNYSLSTIFPILIIICITSGEGFWG